MPTDDQKKSELISAGWEQGVGDDAVWWWRIGGSGWGRTLDEAYDCIKDAIEATKSIGDEP